MLRMAGSLSKTILKVFELIRYWHCSIHIRFSLINYYSHILLFCDTVLCACRCLNLDVLSLSLLLQEGAGDVYTQQKRACMKCCLLSVLNAALFLITGENHKQLMFWSIHLLLSPTCNAMYVFYILACQDCFFISVPQCL